MAVRAWLKRYRVWRSTVQQSGQAERPPRAEAASPAADQPPTAAHGWPLAAPIPPAASHHRPSPLPIPPHPGHLSSRHGRAPPDSTCHSAIPSPQQRRTDAADFLPSPPRHPAPPTRVGAGGPPRRAVKCADDSYVDRGLVRPRGA